MALLALRPGDTAIDATCGLGGHTVLLARAVGERGTVLAIDRDAAALAAAQRRLAGETAHLLWRQAPFAEIERLAGACLGRKVAGIVFDLGVSSMQLDTAARGFSFRFEAPLDMRMDPSGGETAGELIARRSEEELSTLLREYGEERFARRIAAAIVQRRSERPLASTAELAALIERAVPAAYRRGPIHPATRTFQALRIAVNDEFGQLAAAIPAAARLLAPGGRLAAISFHSLEDRAIKRLFRDLARGGDFAVQTKKPICPTAQEIARNPRSRSAKLRVLARREAA